MTPRKRTTKPAPADRSTCSSLVQNGTKRREKAAQLVAEDRLPDEKIATEVGIGRQTLARWKKDPLFIGRVQEITEAFAQRALKHRIARKECRIAVLGELHDKMLTVFQERSQSPEMSHIPGGKTGLLTRTLKGSARVRTSKLSRSTKLIPGRFGKSEPFNSRLPRNLGRGFRR